MEGGCGAKRSGPQGCGRWESDRKCLCRDGATGVYFMWGEEGRCRGGVGLKVLYPWLPIRMKRKIKN